MKPMPKDPRFNELEQAKRDLSVEQHKYPQDEELTHDGCWDEIETIWYDLIDDYDQEDLKRWGIQPT